MALEIMSEDAEDVKHKLQNHSDLIEANPRSIKRLANQYNVYRDILIAERREFALAESCDGCKKRKRR